MKEISLNITLDSDGSEHPEFANQGMVNAYAVAGSPDRARASAVQFAAGLISVIDTGNNICRGGIAIVGDVPLNDVAYFGFEAGVYKITWDGTNYSKTNIGIIPGRGKLMFARNAASPFQVGVINADGQFSIIENDEVRNNPTEGINSPKTGNRAVWNSIAYVKNHIVLGMDDGYMFSTKLLDMTDISGVNFANAEAQPDGLIAVAGWGDHLVAFGRDTIEFYRTTGSTTGFPFANLSGTTATTGCGAKHSIQEVDQALYFVTSAGHVAALSGYQPKRVSNQAVELSISAVSDPETIESYMYADKGQVFYGITHSTFTWEYNVATKLWHQRKSYGSQRWRATGFVKAFNKYICGDYLTGDIWDIDSAARREGVDPVVVEIRTEPLEPNGKVVSVARLEIDAVTGRAAISGDQTTTDPKIMLDWTDNGCEPYAGERHLGLGAIGERAALIATNRLGTVRRGKRRTFRIRCSDPVVSGFRNPVRVFVE